MTETKSIQSMIDERGHKIHAILSMKKKDPMRASLMGEVGKLRNEIELLKRRRARVKAGLPDNGVKTTPGSDPMKPRKTQTGKPVVGRGQLTFDQAVKPLPKPRPSFPIVRDVTHEVIAIADEMTLYCERIVPHVAS